MSPKSARLATKGYVLVEQPRRHLAQKISICVIQKPGRKIPANLTEMKNYGTKSESIVLHKICKVIKLNITISYSSFSA